MTVIENELMAKELKELEQEHDDLNRLIDEVLQASHSDQLTIQRLKKRKLWIKDRMFNVRSVLYPDIIA